MNEDTFDIRAEQTAPTPSERDFENALRPLQFDDFSGQHKVVENLAGAACLSFMESFAIFLLLLSRS